MSVVKPESRLISNLSDERRPDVAVLVQCHFQRRHFTVLAHPVQFVEDFPELRFGLYNEAVHRAAGVEQQADWMALGLAAAGSGAAA